MKQTYLKIDFQHYWHVSAGVHRNKTLEALKDRDGFPYISDQQCHGILKDICQQAEAFGRIPSGTTLKLFGHGSHLEQTPQKQPKWIQLGAARLASKTREACKTQNTIARLYKTLPSNSQDEEGITKKGHLRFIETVIPVTLHSRIEQNADATCEQAEYKAAIKELKKALVGRHRLGHDKNSGFGRCTLSLEESPPMEK